MFLYQYLLTCQTLKQTIKKKALSNVYWKHANTYRGCDANAHDKDENPPVHVDEGNDLANIGLVLNVSVNVNVLTKISIHFYRCCYTADPHISMPQLSGSPDCPMLTLAICSLPNLSIERVLFHISEHWWSGHVRVYCTCM